MTDTEMSPPLDRLLTWSLKRPLLAWIRYAVTTIVIPAVGVFRVLVVGSIVPWLLFIPVVLISGLLLGRATGVYAAVLSAIVAALSIGDPTEPLWLTRPQWIGSVLFVLVALGTAILAAELRTVFARLEQLSQGKGAAENARMGDQTPIRLRAISPGFSGEAMRARYGLIDTPRSSNRGLSNGERDHDRHSITVHHHFNVYCRPDAVGAPHSCN